MALNDRVIATEWQSFKRQTVQAMRSKESGGASMLTAGFVCSAASWPATLLAIRVLAHHGSEQSPRQVVGPCDG
ncbi:MAG: hypothetical protein ACRD1T_07180, partial [Acidimicrobiia bacterium]